MTNHKNTKRALLSSMVSLVLCFAMLLGTTFAWFTDTASTSVNKIQAGTLKIELLDKNGTSLEDRGALSWQTADNRNAEDILWEPGATYNLEPITIKNDGNLALKYKIAISGIQGDAKLNEVIDWTIKVGNDTYSADSEFHLTAGATNALTISGHMKESAGNAYMDMSIEGISITLYATQDTVEADSTGSDYDQDAEYPKNLGLKWSGNAAPLTRNADTPENVKTLEDVTDHDAKTVKIDDPELLAAFALAVSGESNTSTLSTQADPKDNGYLGYTIYLENDFDLDNKDWTPIGTAENPFRGNFDGQGHTISNLKVNGGVENPIDTEATCQGLFGCWKAQQQVIEFKDLKIYNADIYAKDSAGAVIGCMDNVYRDYINSGETWIHDIEVTGKVTIEGGNAGTVAGAPSDGWNFYCAIHDVTVDVDEGSYISNLEAVKNGGGACIGGIVANASRSYGSWNLTSNIDVYGSYGIVGGVAGLAGGIWYNCSCSGDVYVKNASLDDNDKYIIQHATVLGTPVPTMGKSNIQFDTLTSTGKFTYEYTDGTIIYTNKQISNNYGAWAW